MVEPGLLPAVFIVTVATHRPKPAAVDILDRMAVVTAKADVLVVFAKVAVRTWNVRVLAMQGEFGLPMIEGDDVLPP